MQGLGFAYANSLVKAGSSCLVLTSRSARLCKEDLISLAENGATAFILQADSSHARVTE